jgi:hypothetical protein
MRTKKKTPRTCMGDSVLRFADEASEIIAPWEVNGKYKSEQTVAQKSFISVFTAESEVHCE